MRILHFIPERTENVDVRKEYFRHLMTMSNSVEVRIMTTDGNSNFDNAEKLPKLLPIIGKRVGKIINEFHPDIIHIHGCTGHIELKVFSTAVKHRIPVVVSPLGELASITLTEKSTVKRFTSDASRARKIIWGADAIHVTGEIEMETVRKMQIIPGKELYKDIGKKTFMIKNSVLTNSITAEEMCAQFISIYNKVSYRRTFDVMLPETKEAEKIILRTGICERYNDITKEEEDLIRSLNNEELEKIFIHSELENVREYIDEGCKVLAIPFSPNRASCREKAGLSEIIEDINRDNLFKDTERIKSKNNKILRDFENYEEEVYLFCILSSSQSLMHKGCLTYRHLAEIHHLLVNTDYREDVIFKMFKDTKIYDFAASLMHVMEQYTGLPEGFMPVVPLNNKKTKEIITFLTLKQK